VTRNLELFTKVKSGAKMRVEKLETLFPNARKLDKA
jgi:hypothetical protein